MSSHSLRMFMEWGQTHGVFALSVLGIVGGVATAAGYVSKVVTRLEAELKSQQDQLSNQKEFFEAKIKSERELREAAIASIGKEAELAVATRVLDWAYTAEYQPLRDKLKRERLSNPNPTSPHPESK